MCSSMDTSQVAQLDHFVEVGDWDGVVLALDDKKKKSEDSTKADANGNGLSKSGPQWTTSEDERTDDDDADDLSRSGLQWAASEDSKTDNDPGLQEGV